MKIRFVIVFLVAAAILAGCGAKGAAESEVSSIADECQSCADKLAGLTGAAAVNAELDQLAKRVEFHTGQLAGQVSKRGKEAVRASVGTDTRNRLNRGLTALIKAVQKAEAKFGKAAVASGVQAVKGAIARLSSTL